MAWVPAVIGVAGSIVTCFIGYRIGLHAKWWDKMYAAYTGVIVALSSATRYSHAMAEAYASSGQSIPDNGVDREGYRKAVSELKDYIARGPYEISSTAHCILESLPFAASQPSEAPEEYLFDEDRTAFADALKKIRRIAHDELGKPIYGTEVN